MCANRCEPQRRTPRERVLRAIEFRSAGGRIPFTVSAHSTFAKYGEPLLRVIRDTGCDLYDVNELKIPDAETVNKTTDTDVWGSRWNCALPAGFPFRFIRGFRRAGRGAET